MNDPVIAQRLKALRREKGLTQLDVARMIQVSNTTLSQYESGKRSPSFAILRQLAGIYVCSTDYLLGVSEQKHAPAAGETLTEIELKTLTTLKQNDSTFFSLFCDCIKLNDRDMITLRSIMMAYIADRND